MGIKEADITEETIQRGFNSISIKGIAIVIDTAEAREDLKDRLDVILVSKDEWFRIEKLLKKQYNESNKAE